MAIHARSYMLQAPENDPLSHLFQYSNLITALPVTISMSLLYFNKQKMDGSSWVNDVPCHVLEHFRPRFSSIKYIQWSPMALIDNQDGVL